MTITPNPTRRLTPLEIELYAALGADSDLAHRLAQRGLLPEMIVGLDHPNCEQYADNGDDDYDDFVDSIIRNFPAFDPAVLEHAATRPWCFEDLTSGHMYTPGPLNRYMAVRDAGISIPALYGAFNTFEAPDPDYWAELDKTDADTVLHIRENDLHITLSIDGATWNQQTNTELVAVTFGGEPTPALKILDVWIAATRSRWPGHFDSEVMSEAAAEVDIDGADSNDLHIVAWRLSDGVSRRRFAALAPSLPTWFEAFAAEHPDHDI